MKDDKPEMKIIVKGQRMYRSKKLRMDMPSVNPIAEYAGKYGVCREEIISRFQSWLQNKDNYNDTIDSSYIMKFLPYYFHPRTKEPLHGKFTMGIYVSTMKHLHLMGSNEDKDTLKKLVTIVVGLVDTALYHNENNKSRKALIDSYEDLFDIADKDILYSGCSSETVNNPFTLSLMMGLYRDCFLAMSDNDRTIIASKEFVDRFDIDEIFRIIKDNDHLKAKEIIKTDIIPFFNEDPIVGVEICEETENYDEETDDYYYEDDWEYYDEGNNEIDILGSPHILKSFKHLLDNGIGIFNDDAIKNYEVTNFDFGIGMDYYNDFIDEF